MESTANLATRLLLRDAGDENDRTRQIIVAAYDLLDEDGLEGLTIRAVLARTGLARRAFYDRFAGKDDLVLAVFEQTLRGAAAYFAELARALAGPFDRLRMIIDSIVIGTMGMPGASQGQSDRRSAALSREHLRLAESRPAELLAALSPLLNLIAGEVAEGIRLGQIRQCDPALTATLIYNLVSNTVHTELLGEEGERPDLARRKKLAGDLWEFCHRAIAA